MASDSFYLVFAAIQSLLAGLIRVGNQQLRFADGQTVHQSLSLKIVISECRSCSDTECRKHDHQEFCTVVEVHRNQITRLDALFQQPLRILGSLIMKFLKGPRSRARPDCSVLRIFLAGICKHVPWRRWILMTMTSLRSRQPRKPADLKADDGHDFEGDQRDSVPSVLDFFGVI